MAQAADVPSQRMSTVVGGNLLRVRSDRGLTQEQLAVRAGLTRATVAQIEASRDPERATSVTTGTVEALAMALDVDWVELLRPWDAATRAFLDAIPPSFELIHGHGSGTGQRPLMALAR